MFQIQEVREFLCYHVAPPVLEYATRCALDVYNRFDNRRRMGAEVMVLAMLAGKAAKNFEIPDKYHSRTFVLEMMVAQTSLFGLASSC